MGRHKGQCGDAGTNGKTKGAMTRLRDQWEDIGDTEKTAKATFIP